MKQAAADKKENAREKSAPNGKKEAGHAQNKKNASGKAKQNDRPRFSRRTVLLLIVGALALSAVLILAILYALGIMGGSRNHSAETTAVTDAAQTQPAAPEAADDTDEGPVVLTVGGREIREAYYGYVYMLIFEDAANEAYQSMALYGENTTGFDYTVKPSRQTYTAENGETMSYDAFFARETVKKLEYWNYYASYARDHGIALSEEQLSAIDSTVAELKTEGENYGYTLDQYLRALYGRYMNEARFRAYLEEQTLAALGHTSALEAGVETPDADTLAKTPDPDYTVADLRIFGVSTTQADAGERVNAMAARVIDEASFITLAKEYCTDRQKESGEFEDEDATLFLGVEKNVIVRLFGEEAAQEMFAASAAGKTFILTEQDGEWTYALYVIRPAYFEQDPPVTIRHIFISNSTMGEEGAPAPEAPNAALPAGMTAQNALCDEDTVKKACLYANEVYQKFLSGEKTEEAFAALAEEYSQDTDSVGENGFSSGGLYRDITKGYRSNVWIYSRALADWAFDGARKAGDTAMIQSMYGVHIVYFVERAQYPAWLQSMLDDAEADAAQEFEKTVQANYLGSAQTNGNTAAAAANAIALIESLYYSNAAVTQ